MIKIVNRQILIFFFDFLKKNMGPYTILNIKFGVNGMFHVLNIPVYRFDYRTLWTDEDKFW